MFLCEIGIHFHFTMRMKIGIILCGLFNIIYILTVRSLDNGRSSEETI